MWRRKQYSGAGGASAPRSPIFDYFLTLALFGVLIAIIVRFDATETIARAGVPVIIDGDSMVLDSEKIRLKGIDAPEIGQTCVNSIITYYCGEKAKNRLRDLIAGSKVTCEGWQRDKYQRLLGTCRAGAHELNRDMVVTGWAVAYGGYSAEEAKARGGNLGIWAGPFERPHDWRRIKGSAEEEPHGIWLSVSDYFKTIYQP